MAGSEHDTRKGVRSNCWHNPGYAASPLGGWPDLPRCPACEPVAEQRVCTCPRTVVKGAKHTAINCPFREASQEPTKPFKLESITTGLTALKWPESENYSREGEALTRNDMRALRDALSEELGDGRK